MVGFAAGLGVRPFVTLAAHLAAYRAFATLPEVFFVALGPATQAGTSVPFVGVRLGRSADRAHDDTLARACAFLRVELVAVPLVPALAATRAYAAVP